MRHPPTRPFAFLWLALALCACAPAVKGAPRPKHPHGDAYVEALVAQARARELHDHPQWLRLGHYRPRRLGGGVRSEADGRYFFLAREGATDPEAELVADLRAFFEPPVQEPPVERSGLSRHALCRFPARFAFLSRELSIDPKRLPAQRCPRFFKFLSDLNPTSVSVVFSSYFLNNPASAFGHTFLRFHKATRAVGEQRELLDYAVNFAANVDTGNSLIYAFKGVFGLFPGTAKRLPYYFKVREYADTESRDIWQYELNFSPQELYMLVAHVWEIGSTHFAYYYLDENCSYRINMMLEAASSNIHLMRETDGSLAVLPVDTVKALLDNPGLVRKVSYRPSLRTQFEWRAKDLDGEQADYVERLASDAEVPLPDSWSTERKVAVLDAALDLVDVRHVKDLVFKRDEEAAKKKQTLLSRRAAERVQSSTPEVPAPNERRPDIGHDTARAHLRLGYRAADRNGTFDGGFAELGFRIALHDLADPAAGYPELSEIEFLPVALRVFAENDKPRLVLERASLVRILSLTSVSRFDLSMSWHVDARGQTLEDEGCRRCFAAGLSGGAGLAKALFANAVTAFATLDLDAKVLSEAGGGIADSVFRAGLGPAAGLRLRFAQDLILLAQGRLLFYPEQTDGRVLHTDASLRWGVANNLALDVQGRLRPHRKELSLAVMGYF